MRDVLALSLVCSSLCNDSPCANKNKGLQQSKQGHTEDVSIGACT
jgi:hypothetical protein